MQKCGLSKMNFTGLLRFFGLICVFAMLHGQAQAQTSPRPDPEAQRLFMDPSVRREREGELFVPGFPSLDQQIQPMTGLADPQGSQIVRYSCCDNLEIRVAPEAGARVLNRLQTNEMVWVQGLVDDIGGHRAVVETCLSAYPVACGSIWAHVYVPERSAAASTVSGYVPLTALFARSERPEVGEAQFELSFGRLAREIHGQIDRGLINSPGCSNPADVLVASGRDVQSRDSVFLVDRSERRMCSDALSERCAPYLASCAGLDENSKAIRGCVYQTVAECGRERPARQPSASLRRCIEPCRPSRAICRDCRTWYDATGQGRSGWKTSADIYDQCLQESLNCRNLAPTSDATLCEIDMMGCRARATDGMTALCEPYVGPNDTKRFGNPAAYQCGELPFGHTHLGYREGSVLAFDGRAQMQGNPDHAWKHLDFIDAPPFQGRISAGRRDHQVAFSYRQRNLTSGRVETISAPKALTARSIWLTLRPHRPMVDRADGEGRERADVLDVGMCLHAPGVAIDLGRLSTPQSREWELLATDIDLGSYEIARFKACGTLRFIARDGTLEHDWLGDLKIEHPFSRILRAPDVTAGPVTQILRMDLPIIIENAYAREAVRLLLTGSPRAVQRQHARMLAALLTRADGVSGSLVDLAVQIAGSRLPLDMEKPLKTAISDAIDLPQINPQERISEVCQALTRANAAPTLGHFYNFLRRNCEGLASHASLRLFVPHEASSAAGCYDPGQYFAPADARENPWWAGYSGQNWWFPLWPDQGCRVAAKASLAMDRALWPILRCAVAQQNAIINSQQRGARTALIQDIVRSCQDFGQRAIAELYGSGQDLASLLPARGGVQFQTGP